MNKDQPLLNPSIKTDLVNSNSELTSDKHQNSEILSTGEDTRDGQVENYALEKSLEVEQPNVKVKVEQPKTAKQKDFIPVAYRVLGDKKPLLDVILTPWGIFSIVLFFVANAILFVNFTRKSPEVMSLDSQETPSEVMADDNQNEINKQILSNKESGNNQPKQISESKKEDSNQLTNENVTSIGDDNSLSTTKKIPNPISVSSPSSSTPLNTLNPNSQPQIIVNQKSSPYPDLATALLFNSNQTTPTNNIPNLIQSPPLAVKNNPNPSPSSNSESAINNLQYYVITEYNGIEFFEQIQTIFPDALITNIETEIKIQLGVFDNETNAHKLIQQLKQKQINAYIYTSESNPK